VNLEVQIQGSAQESQVRMSYKEGRRESGSVSGTTSRAPPMKIALDETRKDGVKIPMKTGRSCSAR